MIEIAVRFLIFYASGAGTVGIVFATMQSVKFSYRGKPVRHPRLFGAVVAGAVVAGAVWPWVIWQIIFPPKGEVPEK